MPTFHQQLLAAALATQQSLPGLPAAQVQVDRDIPVTDRLPTALVIQLGDARKEAVIGSDGEFDLVRARVEIVFSLHTRGGVHTPSADPLIAASNAALMADPSLGGLAQRLSWFSSRPRRSGTEGVGIFDITYEATVVVNERTLAIWTP